MQFAASSHIEHNNNKNQQKTTHTASIWSVLQAGMGDQSEQQSSKVVLNVGDTRCQLHIRSNVGVQYLAQGYFDM